MNSTICMQHTSRYLFVCMCVRACVCVYVCIFKICLVTQHGTSMILVVCCPPFLSFLQRPRRKASLSLRSSTKKAWRSSTKWRHPRPPSRLSLSLMPTGAKSALRRNLSTGIGQIYRNIPLFYAMFGLISYTDDKIWYLRFCLIL